MDTIGLPEVVFGQATTADQTSQCNKLAATAFSAPLTEAEYLQAQQYLGERPLTRDGGWRVWYLAWADDPAREVLATCRTIRRDLLLRDAQGSRIERGYCVAGVATASRWQKRGLASRLLEHVKAWLDGPGEAAASMLSTSIGDFYAKRGWRPLVPVYQSTLAFPPGRSLQRAICDIPRGRLIPGEELSRLCITDVEDVKREFATLATGPGDMHVAVLPTPEIISWLHDRGDFVAQKTLGRVSGHHGAISECGRIWLYWYHDFRKEQLGIQRVRLPPRLDEHDEYGRDVIIRRLAGLLYKALQEAEEWGLPKVVVWEPTTAVTEAMDILSRRAGVSVRTEERIGRSIPSLRFRADDTPSSVHFHMKEFYMWS